MHKNVTLHTSKHTGNNSNKQKSTPSVSKIVLDLLAAIPTHEIPVAALCQATALFGIAEQTTRVALTRLVQSGKVSNPQRGIYRIDPNTNNLFRIINHWMTKEDLLVPWAGEWIGVSDSAVEKQDRTLIRAHQRALALTGFKLLRKGLYIRPNNLQGGIEKQREELQHLGLAPKAIVFGMHELANQDEKKAKKLWNVNALITHYEDMLAQLTTSQAQLSALTTEEAAVESLLLGRDIIRRIVRDPLLPEELVPSKKRKRLIALMRTYQEHSQTLWYELLQLSEETRYSPFTAS